MKKYHLGINLGHDRSVAIVCDGEIQVAIQQERIDRSKHSLGYLHQFVGNDKTIQLPWESINYCLEELNINLNDLDTITANMPGKDYSELILKRSFNSNLREKIKIIPSHHLSHAYSAYFPSGFNESLIISVDASGSVIDNNTESYSIYTAKDNSIELLHSETVQSHTAQLSTLGFLYEYISRKANFVTSISDKLEIPESGKLMGLASYGSFQKKWNKWFKNYNNSFRTDIFSYDIFLELEALTKVYDNGKNMPHLRPYIVDLAFKIQQELEEVMMHLVKIAVQKTGINKLCIAGGVGLNSVANYKVYNELNLDDIFIFPAAGDAGIAAGNAFWAYHQYDKSTKRKKMNHAFLGHSYSEHEIKDALMSFDDKIQYNKISDHDLLETSSKKLAKGSIIAIHQGGCEFGPRALGHRSIVVDPTLPRMKDILNARVKYRESFRPFAPVVPEDISEEIFVLKTYSPFMLLVADIKEKYHDILPAITHNDGTGRVQTVNKKENKFFYNLAYALKKERKGPAVLLNTSFNIAGQPIVETPKESIETYLNTDIDYLIIDNYWIKKKGKEIKNYEEHLLNLQEPINPCGLDKGTTYDLSEMMKKLDLALFYNHNYQDHPWSNEELRVLSAFGAKYKEHSLITKTYPLGKNFKSQIENKAVVFLNPLGKSVIRSLLSESYFLDFTYEEIRLVSHCYNATEKELSILRTELMLSEKEFEEKLQWANKILFSFDISPCYGYPKEEKQWIQLNRTAKITLEHFKDEQFEIFHELKSLYTVLLENGYNEDSISKKLNILDLQSIEPTYMPYYDSIVLGSDKLDMLIRLFLIRGGVNIKSATLLFGKNLLNLLFDLKVLYKRRGQIASYIDIFCIKNQYIATDHRFLFLSEDKISEDPVMYIGSDSFGLVNTAPRKFSKNTLDLCTGSGIQSIIASRYSDNVVAVDINPRAIRFARFNTQLNGVKNVQIIQSNLYNSIPQIKYDVILANPPFVPSPDLNMKFRDGGVNGESILSSIIQNAPNYLSLAGRLYIVTDLVDVDNYKSKLLHWWGEDSARIMILKTADRNEILFSVPHCHYPFDQSYHEYKDELIKWVDNFKNSNLKLVNFGYILIERSNDKIFFSKTISNPSIPIYNLVNTFFTHHDLIKDSINNLILSVHDDIRLRREGDLQDTNLIYKLFAEKNPYFTEYIISKQIYEALINISKNQVYYKDFKDVPFINDLIKKGILILNRYNQSVEVRCDKKNYSSNQDGILEMETKTTPTCLTSYLKQ